MERKRLVISMCLVTALFLVVPLAHALTFTDGSGGDGTIEFNLQPEANIDFHPKSGPAPLFVTFQNRSRFEDSFEWTWWLVSCVNYDEMNVNIGDTTTSSQVIPYLHTGTHAVYLFAENDAGVDFELVFVEVTEPMRPFNADFVASHTLVELKQGEESTSIDFSAAVDFTPVIEFGYLWNFGDGGFSRDPAPTHEFRPGTYTVTLDVSDCTGDYAARVTKLRYITVTPFSGTSEPQPEADFIGAPLTVEAGETVNFLNSSQNATSYLWDFGDGTSSTVQKPNHVYNEPGTYTVSLTALNATGGSDTETKVNYITVTGDAPPSTVVIDFYAAPTRAVTGTDVYFINTSTGTFDESLWSFGDGTGATGQNPTHQYENAGVYSVNLQVILPTGAALERTKSNYITVVPATTTTTIEPLFTADPVSGTTPHVVQFKSLSSDPFQNIWWDFGDGTTSNEQNPLHTYEIPGTHTVTLFVDDAAATKLDYIYTVPSADDYQTPAGYVLAGNLPDLETLGAFRDAVMTHSLYGTGLIELYYKHGLELVTILQNNPDLYAEAQAIVIELMPLFDAAVADGTFSIPPEHIQSIITVLGNIADQAGPELGKALIKLMRDLDDNEFFQSVNTTVPVTE